MTRAIGREVRFEGPMEMRLSLTPSIRIGVIDGLRFSGQLRSGKSPHQAGIESDQSLSAVC